MAHIHHSVFMAPTSVVTGNVTLGPQSSVWHQAVIRADLAPITIGARTNIQDAAVLHVSRTHPVSLGNDVIVGHGAIVHGCTVGDGTLVGMGAILLDGAQVGKHCIVGAGALVTQGMVIPDNSVAFGSPARVVRQTTNADRAALVHNAEEYVMLARQAMEESAR